jgi:chromosome partitioning protein
VKVFAIANQKGGVGKTATSVNLAAALARLGQKTLLIDLDAQAHSTQWLLGAEAGPGKGAYAVLVDKVDPLKEIVPSSFGIDVLPSNVDMENFERNIAKEVLREYRLDNALKKIAKERDYDYVILDCSPSLDISAINALFASSKVIVPIDCGIESYNSISRLLSTISMVAEAQNKQFELFALPTFLERNNLTDDVVNSLKDNFPGQLLSGIRRTVRIAEAFANKKPVFNHDAKAGGALDYENMAKELLVHGA